MHHVKILADLVAFARRGADRWYVTNGATAVGPVNLDLLARGVEAGKVPLESFVRNETWKVWRPLSELAVIVDDERGPVIPEPPPSTDDIADVGRPSTPDDFLPQDAVDGAANNRDALLLLLSAAVARGGAEGAIIHEVHDDGAIAICAHGPNMFDVLGMRTKLLDPALVAAAAGAIVSAEPAPGPAGRAIIDRISKLGLEVEGALMIPIRPNGKLHGMIELGRREPFRPGEIASLEALVDALVNKLEGFGPAPAR